MDQEKPRGKQPFLRKNTVSGDFQMFCPECKEEIQYADVESYLHCPFCNCVLKQTDEFDDFLLDGVVKAWISKNS